MDARQLLRKTATLIEDARAGLLVTVDEDGRPQARWMTPTLLRGRPDALFAVTSPWSAKVAQMRANPEVEWLIQSPALTEIVTLRGAASLVDNPAIKREILDAIGQRLTVFWKVNPERTDLVVIETVVHGGTYLRPMQGVRETVRF